ncbi:hypothetical protein ACFRCX_31190 [Streptomyces sp. NPDC056652]|uniref:hypothetical protein n=1 Tax=Streptomyces sp. NPDC056652 TaxID=3345893 RepID=UPI00367A6BBF
MTTTSPPHGLPPSHDDRPQWWKELRNRRRPVSRTDYGLARRFVDQSGVVPVLEDALRQQRKSAAGRCRTVPVRALFIAMTLDSWRNAGRVVLMEAADILSHQLPQYARTQLGLPEWTDDVNGFEACYRAVRRTFHASVAAMDPSPLPKHRLPRAEALLLEQEADPAVLAHRRRLLLHVTNGIIEASLHPARPVIDHYWDQSIAIDATPLRTFARGVRRDGIYTATDPDAAWYVREGDHRDPADKPTQSGKPGRRPKRYMYGYEASLAVTGDCSGPPGEDPATETDSHLRVPALVIGMSVHRPGHEPARNAVDVLTSLRRRGYPAGILAVDRAYSSAKPETFHDPARDMGYRLIFDYRIDQLGVQGSHAGALLVDGGWHCPHIPQALITATADLLGNHIDRHTWRTRVNARTSYRLRPKASPDARGAQRLLCPAAGTRPTAACPLKRRSLGRDPRLTVVDVTPSPAGPPEICRRESVTFNRRAGSRSWQETEHGSAIWVHRYFRLRNRVEHFNGYSKDREAIERCQTRRVRGLAAQALLLSFQIAHANRRKLAAWLETLHTETHDPRRRASDRYKPRDPSTWTPKGYLPDSK